MIEFTFNNHLSYFCGGRRYGWRESCLDKFTVSVGTVDQDIIKRSSWRDQLRFTADRVAHNLGKDLILFLSGGTDSEIVARNFMEIGIKPECAIIKFKNDYNKDDVIRAINFCMEFDLKYTLLDFDVKEFFNSGEAIEFSKAIQCTQITYLMIYNHIMKLGRPAVMGGEIFLKKHISFDTDPFWYYCFRENEDASAMRFSIKYNIPLVNEWFSYTPEMILLYLQTTGIRDLVNNTNRYKLTSVSTKNKLLNELYPEVCLRVKTHGFERLMGFNAETYALMKSNMHRRLEPSLDGIPYHNMITKLTNGE